jgi:hypothetical protein
VFATIKKPRRAARANLCANRRNSELSERALIRDLNGFFGLRGERKLLCLGMTEAQRKRLKRIMKDALRIQDRFAAEPVLSRTGKGYLKSEGVARLQKIKAGLRKAAAH